MKSKSVSCIKQDEKIFEKPVGVKDVMDYLGRGRTHIYDLMAKKLLPYHQLGGKRYFFLSEIETALKQI